MKELQDLPFESVEIPKPLPNGLEYQFVIDPPVFVNQQVAKPPHSSEDIRHWRGDHAPSKELLEEVVFLSWKPEAEPRNEQGTHADDRLH